MLPNLPDLHPASSIGRTLSGFGGMREDRQPVLPDTSPSFALLWVC